MSPVQRFGSHPPNLCTRPIEPLSYKNACLGSLHGEFSEATISQPIATAYTLVVPSGTLFTMRLRIFPQESAIRSCSPSLC